MGELTLKIVTPKGAWDPVSCDSVHLKVSDDVKGKGGGSYGIRPGHTEGVLALDQGKLEAFLKEKTVLSGECGRGFATVLKDVVTVVAEDFLSERFSAGKTAR